MFLYPFYKGLSAVVLMDSIHVLCWKPNRSTLSSGDLKLLSLCFNFLTGHNYVLMYWIIFSSGCFTTYLNYTGFPCSHPLPDRGISSRIARWGPRTAAAGTAVVPILWGEEAGTGMGRCFLVSVGEVWVYKDVRSLISILTGTALLNLSWRFICSFLSLLHADCLER